MWRNTSVPMKIPFSFRRMAAYHIVVASIGALIGHHGRGGSSSGVVIPASASWRPVAI